MSEKALTIRVPAVLYGCIAQEVEKRKRTTRRYSWVDWMVEAAREKLDRDLEPPTEPLVASVFGPPAPRSAPVATAERRTLVPFSDL